MAIGDVNVMPSPHLSIWLRCPKCLKVITSAPSNKPKFLIQGIIKGKMVVPIQGKLRSSLHPDQGFFSSFVERGRLHTPLPEFLIELLFHSFFYGAIEVSVMKDENGGLQWLCPNKI